MKKILSFLLAALMLLSISACTKPAPEEELVTIYVLTKEKEYRRDPADRMILHSQTLYTYDNGGNLLSTQQDRGDVIEIWNEDTMSFDYSPCHIDGTIDTTWEYRYDNHGTMVNYIWNDTYYGYNRKEDYTNYVISYTYNEAGQIASMIKHGILLGGATSDETWTTFYRYDKNGNLIRVESEQKNSDTLLLNNKFSYDEQNRLTQAFYYTFEHAQLFEYSYDDEGRLNALKYYYTSYGNGINEQDDTYRLLENTQFTYDEQGNLTSKKTYNQDGRLTSSTICEYDSGKLTSVCSYALEMLRDQYTFTYQAEDAEEGGYEVLCNGISLVYDENGNLIKKASNGAYSTTYEYTAMRVTKAQAERYRRIQYLKNHTEADGSTASFDYSIMQVHYALIPYPTTIFNNGMLNDIMQRH